MSLLFNDKANTLFSGTEIIGKWNKKKYVVKRLLGSGENGEVFLVESNNNLYALKLSPASLDLSYEIQIIQQLNKAQGPTLGFYLFDIDDFIWGGTLYTYYVMRYQRGISIDRYLRRKEAVDYFQVFRLVIEKLFIIHDHGWVFGDLKPEHILIEPKTKQISFIDYGGLTRINEGVRQYTDIFDRGSWKVGTRKADQHYDLFSIVMVFVKIGIGKNRFLKIYNQTRSINNVYGIIRGINVLNPLSSIFKRVFFGELKTTSEVIEVIVKESKRADRIEVKKHRWIDWSFSASLFVFLTLFIYFIYSTVS